MVVALEEYEIGYVPVPKAACTMVKSALTALDPAAPELGQGRGGRRALHARYRTRRFRPAQFRPYRDFYHFTVVRDPVERLLAVYCDLMADPDAIRLEAGASDLARRPDPDLFFQNLDAYRAASPMVKHRARRQAFYVGSDLAFYDRIYTSSGLGILGRDLTAMTGRPIALPEETQDKPALGFDDLAPRTHRALRRELDGEYALLGKLFTPPW